MQKLIESNQEFLTEKCIGIMEDLNSTLQRNTMLMGRKRPPPFKSVLTHDGSLPKTAQHQSQPQNDAGFGGGGGRKQKVAQPSDQNSKYFNVQYERKNKQKNAFGQVVDEDDYAFNKNDQEYGYAEGGDDQQGNFNVHQDTTSAFDRKPQMNPGFGGAGGFDSMQPQNNFNQQPPVQQQPQAFAPAPQQQAYPPQQPQAFAPAPQHQPPVQQQQAPPQSVD